MAIIAANINFFSPLEKNSATVLEALGIEITEKTEQLTVDSLEKLRDNLLQLYSLNEQENIVQLQQEVNAKYRTRIKEAYIWASENLDSVNQHILEKQENLFYQKHRHYFDYCKDFLEYAKKNQTLSFSTLIRNYLSSKRTVETPENIIRIFDIQLTGETGKLTDDILKKYYRQLSSKCHSDTVLSGLSNVPPIIGIFVKNQQQLVNNGYDWAKNNLDSINQYINNKISFLLFEKYKQYILTQTAFLEYIGDCEKNRWNFVDIIENYIKKGISEHLTFRVYFETIKSCQRNSIKVNPDIVIELYDNYKNSYKRTIGKLPKGQSFSVDVEYFPAMEFMDFLDLILDLKLSEEELVELIQDYISFMNLKHQDLEPLQSAIYIENDFSFEEYIKYHLKLKKINIGLLDEIKKYVEINIQTNGKVNNGHVKDFINILYFSAESQDDFESGVPTKQGKKK